MFPENLEKISYFKKFLSASSSTVSLKVAEREKREDRERERDLPRRLRIPENKTS